MVPVRTPTVTASVPTRARGRFISQPLFLPARGFGTPGGFAGLPAPRRTRCWGPDPAASTSPAPEWITSCDNVFFLVNHAPDGDHAEQRIERVLEEGLGRVDSPQAA